MTTKSKNTAWLTGWNDGLEAEQAREIEGEHSPAELRQMLDESFVEKKKCWFAIGQQQKAIENLIKERDALALGIDQWRVDYHELRLEYNELASAAKLALLALGKSGDCLWDTGEDLARETAALCYGSITALRQAGVQ